MSYEVLARKYRPMNFEEVIGQDHVVKALVNSIDSKKIHQAFIFSGTRGVGKTTIARILAKCMNCESDSKPTSQPCNKCSNTIEISAGRSLDFLEIDAASNTQVEKMRDLIETIEYKPSKSRFKVYLIDEVHMLSTASFNALLKTLEEPPPHVVFILATTNPEKIPKTVQSRCLQLNLKTVNKNLLLDHLKSILDKEKINFDDKSVSLIANSAQGSVRDALTLLDQAIAHGNGELKYDDVQKLLGTIDNSLLISMINAVVEGNGDGAFTYLHKIEELSPEYESILKSIISVLHKISIEQVLKNSDDADIKDLSAKIDAEFCQLLYEISVNAYSKFNVHPNAKEAIEICLLRMLAFNPLLKIDDNNSPSGSEKKNLENEISPTAKISLSKKDDEMKSVNLNSDTTSEITNISINSNEEWIKIFNSLNISPFARNYFGYLSFKSYENNLLVLESNEEEINIPENVFAEFKTICMPILGNKLSIEVQLGEGSISPISKQNEIESEKQLIAEESVSSDPSIQNFLKKFDANIKDGSIKPIE
jgi:DNA polymerase-3 subunit gamma/tau